MPNSSKPVTSTEFSRRLIKARKDIDFNIADLSRHLGVNPKTIRDWDAARSEPRSNKLSMLAGLLGVSVGWLLAGGEQAEIDDQSIKHDVARLRLLMDEMTLIIDRLEQKAYS